MMEMIKMGAMIWTSSFLKKLFMISLFFRNRNRNQGFDDVGVVGVGGGNDTVSEVAPPFFHTFAFKWVRREENLFDTVGLLGIQCPGVVDQGKARNWITLFENRDVMKEIAFGDAGFETSDIGISQK